MSNRCQSLLSGKVICIAGIVINNSISNTIVFEIPWFTTKPVISFLMVLKLEFARITRSIPWLLMPWLLTSPDHLQPWYCLSCKMNSSLFSMRKNFKYLCHLSVETWHKIYISMFPERYSAWHLDMCTGIEKLTLTMQGMEYAGAR